MRLTRILAAFALTLGCIIGATSSQAQTDEGRFDVTLRGVKAGQLVFRGRQSGSNYEAVGTLQTTGVVGRLVKIRYDASSNGSVRGQRYTPSRYTEDANTDKRKQRTVIRYRGGVPQTPQITPAETPKPYAVRPSSQGGTVDIMTALYAILRDQDPAVACTQTFKMYDGSRSSQIRLSRGSSTSGGGLTCSGEYRRLAGFSPGDMAERTRFPFTMTLAPAGNKLRVMEIRTSSTLGNAIMRRR